MIRILGFCGSLRVGSRNLRALEIARDLSNGVCELILWRGLAKVPPFSPDLDQPGSRLPEPVSELHELVEGANGLLIACPEYAHGIPGAFKNALDWLVGSTVFPGKPIALLNVAHMRCTRSLSCGRYLGRCRPRSWNRHRATRSSRATTSSRHFPRTLNARSSRPWRPLSLICRS